MDEFGRGGRWICECGDFYDTLEGCKKCKNARMMTIMARKRELNRLNGIPNRAAQKRARKATATKIVNLFKLGELDKGRKMLYNLHKKSSSRWSHVMKLIRKSCAG